MNLATAERLLEINRRFYSQRGRDFSDTRHRVQPGVRRVLETFRGDESILDLGCGNGTLARELSRRGHRGTYLGLDSSATLLEEAHRGKYEFPVSFVETELVPWPRAHSMMDWGSPAPNSADTVGLSAEVWAKGSEQFAVVTAFALLHHIPGHDFRLGLLAQVQQWLIPEGSFIHSSWQFADNPRFHSRIQPWARVEIDPHQIDDGDYLLDWRHGGAGLRYVHEFHESELTDLAAGSGFGVTTTFYSDGVNRRSGLYQFWRPASVN